MAENKESEFFPNTLSDPALQEFHSFQSRQWRWLFPWMIGIALVWMGSVPLIARIPNKVVSSIVFSGVSMVGMLSMMLLGFRADMQAREYYKYLEKNQKPD